MQTPKQCVELLNAVVHAPRGSGVNSIFTNKRNTGTSVLGTIFVLYLYGLDDNI